MNYSNFHTHSNYCDGKGELTDYVLEAKAKNMISLGFSSHAPIPFPCKWCMKTDDLLQYLLAVDQLKAKHKEIDLYKSLEIDFIPNVTSPSDFANRLDYTIGSVHFVEKLPDGTFWEIDGLHTLFLEGYEKIFHSNIKEVISRYFELTRMMVASSSPTIIGHIDKIKIQNIDGKFFNENDQWYQDEVIKTLDVIQQYGSIIEVNTRGLYQKKSTTPYPSPWMLEHIDKRNIPITLSSDAHHPSDLTNQFSETASLLSKIGFRSLTILHEGKWKPYSFNAHGIKIT
ncbi:MAG TPA: histidinol-phosphatase [Chryseolinea sp.]|nr:histidinol-phosphatase [Chryseolinea sp.]HPH45907.1 histidinol-phosphatase [Chryseolinea sp.]